MAQTETTTGAPHRRGAVALRVLGFALAIILGGIAVWLIATSDTVKSQRIGALSGMWGALIGAYAVFGARRHDQDAPADPGTALELRQNASLARSEDAASQREFQARLEAILRREVQEGVARELAGLRNEVSALRKEILENVGGQLRMERTETTRLFGSNLEALQREVNQLKVRQLGDTGTIDAITYDMDAPERHPVDVEPAQEPAPPGGFPPFRPLEPLRPFGPRNDVPAAHPEQAQPNFPPPVPAQAAPATAGLAVPSGPLPDVLAAAATLTPTPIASTPPTPAFVPTPQRADERPQDQGAAPAGAGDPFATMPRITPFTDFELDSAERAPSVPWRNDAAAPASRPGGRHATAAAPLETGGGGRRRRADDSDNDVLARILARERPPAGEAE